MKTLAEVEAKRRRSKRRRDEIRQRMQKFKSTKRCRRCGTKQDLTLYHPEISPEKVVQRRSLPKMKRLFQEAMILCSECHIVTRFEQRREE